VSTPGRRKALKALAKRKHANTVRVAQGKKPIINGKKVAVSTLAKHGGPGSKSAARKRLRK
jgi:hypothetical protein